MVINRLGQLEESEISILIGKLCVAELEYLPTHTVPLF